MKRRILFTAFAAMALIATSCSKEDGGNPTPAPPPEPMTEDVWDGTVATAYASGTGTEADPYMITTGAQLAFLHNEVKTSKVLADTYFQLTGNIDMDNRLFSPIGSRQNDALETVSFKGFFDGNGGTIKGLKLDETKSPYTGLFAYIAPTATVKSLHVEGDISNTTVPPNNMVYTGGIAGVNNGKIIDCTYSGNVYHEGAFGVGGIAGTNYNFIMGCGYIGAEGKKVYNNDPASNNIGTAILGGIVGTMSSYTEYGYSAHVIACYNTGVLETSSGGRMGGIAGEVINSSKTNPLHNIIVACYNRGSMVTRNGESRNQIGGIAGMTMWGHTMAACYSTATITDVNAHPNSYKGGILGYFDSGNTALPSNTSSCYWLDTAYDKASHNEIGDITKDCVSKTETQLKGAEVIASLNAAIAEYNDGALEKCPYKYVAGSDGYPKLKKD